MHFSAILLSSAAVVSMVAAAEPNCLVGLSKTTVESFTKSLNTFCNNQSSKALIEGITFTLEGKGCEQATCVENFNKFAQRCGFNGRTITGGGNIATDDGCGKYTFQISGNSTTSNTTITQPLPTKNTTQTPLNLPTPQPQPTVISPPAPPAEIKPTAPPAPTGAASMAKVSGGLIVGIASIFIMFM